MLYKETIKGKFVCLNSATEADASDTLKIRQNPVICKYIPYLDITVEQQKAWIRKQNADPSDYFFAVRDLKGNFLGTVSVYDIQGKEAETGRVALVGDPYQNIEACILLDEFVFDILKLKKIHGYMYANNKRAARFNKSFGCKIGDVTTDKNGTEIKPVFLTSEDFHVAEEKLNKMLYKNIDQ